ncbi:MAG TPA: hypothetical protein PLS60_07065 [Arenimonas sp.]|nr:hypothetical protein [Arenimonas sp.]
MRKNMFLFAAVLTLLPTSFSRAENCTIQWTSPAGLLAPDVASTAASEIRAAISPDGNTLLWGSPDRKGGPGGWDIWMAIRLRGDWTNPEPVSFNTAAKEFDPVFSPDGKAVYFFSDRVGGVGGDDIYRVNFDAKTASFGAVENLGAEINSIANEWAPTLSSNGKQLLFASNGHGGKGGYDLFVAKRKGNGWKKISPLAGEVNTDQDEFDATWIAAGKALVFSRSNDIVAEKPINLMLACESKKSYVEPQVLGTEINVADGWNFGPADDLSELHTLLFTSHHQDAKRGGLDLYRITYRLNSQK